MEYLEFLGRKRHMDGDFGFNPLYLSDVAFDFQNYIIERAVKKGRMAIYADTGLGKTIIQLSIAYNIILKTNKNVIILTPLAVAFQFIKDAKLLGIEDIEHSRDGRFTKKIVVCNYERLHYFNESDFIGVICDESSILKNFDGKIKSNITTFIKKIPYRFLSTATPAPNDYVEFGTSSEALGYLPYMDMLERFFRNNENNIRPQEISNKWYLKPHAKVDFFGWLLQWALFINKPSDFGFSDEKYILPKLNENIHEVINPNNWVIDGQTRLFNAIAKTMSEVRQEQQGSVKERCEKAIELSSDCCVYWCNFNDEGDLLDELDQEAVQLKGSQSIERKEEILIAFAEGEIKRIITKPKITSFGLNWQHCNHTIYFPTWSYEQYYQAIRRFWRFGQQREVTVDLIVSDGQKRVLDTLIYKTNKAKEFNEIIKKSISKEIIIKKENNEKIKTPLFL